MPRPSNKRKYPDMRRRFQVGDRVSRTYHYPSEEARHYQGTVVLVKEDAIEVEWDSVNGQPMPKSHGHYWDFLVIGKIGYFTPIRKVRK